MRTQRRPADTLGQWRIAQPGAVAALAGRCCDLGSGDGRRRAGVAGLARAGGVGAAAARSWLGSQRRGLGLRIRRPVAPGVPVALAWVLSAAGCNLVMHSVGLRERTQLRRSFESYLDPRIISR